MRFCIAIAPLALIAIASPAQWQTPEQDIPALTDATVESVCGLTAWAFGQESLSGQHRSLIRLELIEAWNSGDVHTMMMAQEIPGVLQAIQMMDPQSQEAMRQQLRQELLQGAQAESSRPTSQVVLALAGQSQPPPAAQQTVPQQSTAVPQTGVPPLTEQIVTDTGRVVAFAFGHPSLQPQHQQMLRQTLSELWASGDIQAIQVCAQMPLICEQIESQPALLEQNRTQWRQFLISTAAQDTQSAFAQLISQLSGQPVQAWALRSRQAGTFEDQAGMHHTTDGMQQNAQMQQDWNTWQQQDNMMYDQQLEQQQYFDQQYDQSQDSGSYDTGSYATESFEVY